MKVSTKARYAVMAMVDLANHGCNSHVSLSEIAARQELPLGGRYGEHETRQRGANRKDVASGVGSGRNRV